MHHNSLGQCHLTGLFQRSRALGEECVSFCLFFSPRRGSSQESTASVKRMEERAREAAVTLSETLH